MPLRLCERSEAIHGCTAAMDRFVASLLAMTTGRGRGHRRMAPARLPPFSDDPALDGRLASPPRCCSGCSALRLARGGDAGLGDPLVWTDEVGRFLMIWLAVLGWLLASRKRIHIRIRFFVDRLPAAWRPSVELVLQLAVALFGALTVWYGRDLVSRNLDIERRRCRSRCRSSTCDRARRAGHPGPGDRRDRRDPAPADRVTEMTR